MSANTYHPQTAKFIATVCQNLPPDISGEAMQGWIQNPKSLQKILGEALCPPVETSDPKVWRTLKLGTYKTADEYRGALKSAGYNVGGWANDILSKPAFICAQQETEVDLVVISVSELGFKYDGRYSDICTRAMEMGLKLCPAEVGGSVDVHGPPEIDRRVFDDRLTEACALFTRCSARSGSVI